MLPGEMQLRRDEARFWRGDTWPGIELMRAHWFRHTFPKHFHDCYTVGINDAGAGQFDCRRQRYEALPHSLNLIEPGETHTGQAFRDRGWIYRDFYISTEYMYELAKQVETNRAPEFRSAAVHDPELANQFRRAFDALTGTATVLEQDHVMLRAIRNLCIRHTDQRTLHARVSHEPAAVARVCDYVHARYADEITIGNLADIVGWSPYHLIRVFQREMGMPPHAYQSVLRVNEAQKRLRRGADIADAALACGFYDQSHMNRVFRRVLGITPGEYRRAISSKT